MSYNVSDYLHYLFLCNWQHTHLPRIIPLGWAGDCQISLTEVVRTSGNKIPTGGPGTGKNTSLLITWTCVKPIVCLHTSRLFYCKVGLIWLGFWSFFLNMEALLAPATSSKHRATFFWEPFLFLFRDCREAIHAGMTWNPPQKATLKSKCNTFNMLNLKFVQHVKMLS